MGGEGRGGGRVGRRGGKGGVEVMVMGGAGGLEAQVTTNDQKKWDGMGSPPGAVGKSGTPLPSTLLTD